jgi:predicted lipoprotein with Yx(FWY)xxD motif
MDQRPLHTSRTALVLGGLALAAAACGSGGSSSTSTHLTDSSASGAAAAGAPMSSAPAGGGTGAVVSTASVAGTTSLVAADGHTLYEADGESAGHIRCVGSCTKIWVPALATAAQARRAAATVGPKLTVVPRPGGGSQLAYAGHPLYAFALEGPHQTHGDGVSDQFDGTSFQWTAATTSTASHARASTGSSSTGGGGYGSNRGYGY